MSRKKKPKPKRDDKPEVKITDGVMREYMQYRIGGRGPLLDIPILKPGERTDMFSCLRVEGSEKKFIVPGSTHIKCDVCDATCWIN